MAQLLKAGDPTHGNPEHELICKYTFNVYRYGTLHGLFVCTRAELEAILTVGRFYSSEDLGKHINFYAPITRETVEVKTDNWGFIEQAREVGLVSGHYISGIDVIRRVRNHIDTADDNGVWIQLEESMRPENFDYIRKHWGVPQ